MYFGHGRVAWGCCAGLRYHGAVAPDEETIDWMFATSEWWLAEFGLLEQTELILPTDDFFQSNDPDDMLDRVLDYAGMADWSFALEHDSELDVGDPMPNVPRSGGPRHVLRSESDDDLDAGQPLPIPLSHGDADNPVALVANLARAVSYYLLDCAEDDIPGGEDNRLYAAELGAILLGFGVFIANSAVEFRGFQQGLLLGWSSQQRGVLGEWAAGYAVGLFVALADIPPRTALKHLDSNPKKACKRAGKEIRKARKSDYQRLLDIRPRATQNGPYR